MIRTLDYPDCTWIDVIAPVDEEVQSVTSEYGVAAQFIAHSLDPHEQPRLRRQDGAALVVLRVPHFDVQAPVPFGTVPFGLVIMPRVIVTICAIDTPALEAVRTHIMDPARSRKPHKVILRALEVLADAYQTSLTAINDQVDVLEDKLRASTENREVLELLKLQKGLVYFTTALRATELMIERLRHAPVIAIPDEDQQDLEDVLIEVRQALEMSSTAAHILSDLMDAFASIISNNLNVVMRLLAALTVILMLPALVSGFYGMNVGLPGAHNPYAFFALSAVSLVVVLFAVLVLRRRRWM
jgi:magnesium transporter